MMKRSIQRRLTLLLGVSIMLSGLVSASISFFLAYDEAKEFQDDTLRQVAYLPALKPSTSYEIKGEGQNPVKPSLKDRESLIRIIHIPDDPRPAWLEKDLSSGLHTLDTGEDRVRVFLQENRPGK